MIVSFYDNTKIIYLKTIYNFTPRRVAELGPNRRAAAGTKRPLPGNGFRRNPPGPEFRKSAAQKRRTIAVRPCGRSVKAVRAFTTGSGTFTPAFRTELPPFRQSRYFCIDNAIRLYTASVFREHTRQSRSEFRGRRPHSRSRLRAPARAPRDRRDSAGFGGIRSAAGVCSRGVQPHRIAFRYSYK